MTEDDGRVAHLARDPGDERSGPLGEESYEVVDVVASLDELRSVLEERARYDCVVLERSARPDGWIAAVEVVREIAELVPIVVLDDEVDAQTAARTASLAGTQYVASGPDATTDPAACLHRAVRRGRRLRELRDREERYRTLMERLPASIYFKDEEGRYVDASRHLREAVTSDPIGKTDVELWSDPGIDLGEQSTADDVAVVETGEPIVDKLEHVETGTGEGWMETTKLPWRDGDEIRGLLGMTQDVTDHKRREEELLRQTQRLEQFASFVSHDLRNPINVAGGYLEHARETGDEAALAEVADALDRMDALVDDLLATVRRGDESPEWVPLDSFVGRTWTGTETEDLSLSVALPEGTVLEAVPGQLRQLLDNLFRNADAHAGTDVTVTVGLTRTGFYVEDDGRGIDPERRDAVLQYGHSESGTGIGLALVAEIAAAHGWEATVTESDEGGARFEFDNCVVRRGGVTSVHEGEPLRLDASTDVGSSAPAGTHERGDDGDAWVVSGGGRDLWNEVDEHYFVYGQADGGLRVEARVAEFDPVHEFSKAGVMVREWAGVGAPLAFVGTTASNGSEVGTRSFPGDVIETDQFESHDGLPRWYRLDWINNTVTLETAVDGSEWTTLDRRPIAGGSPFRFGLAVCSHDHGTACTARFEDVRAVQLQPASEGQQVVHSED